MAWAPELLQPHGTDAARRRHQRRGEKPCLACQGGSRHAKASGENRTLVADTRPVRNGIPWKPYIYRGSGADAYTGEVVL